MDKYIPLFNQTVREFLSSKTNWTGMGMIAGGAVGFYLKQIDAATAMGMIFGGLGFIFVKDAITKSND